MFYICKKNKILNILSETHSTLLYIGYNVIIIIIISTDYNKLNGLFISIHLFNLNIYAAAPKDRKAFTMIISFEYYAVIYTKRVYRLFDTFYIDCKTCVLCVPMHILLKSISMSFYIAG